MTSTREVLEEALRATPDDTALHSAYADLLIEEGDPRGEYIRLSLAAEDRNQPLDRLRQIEQAAFQLRRKHEEQWLGPLASLVDPRRTGLSIAEPMEPNVQVSFRRGWIDRIEVQDLSEPILKAIATAPMGWLLRELVCKASFFMQYGSSPQITVVPISKFKDSPNLQGLRSLSIGWNTPWNTSEAELWAYLPRLEKLYYNVFDDEQIAELFKAHWPKLNILHLQATPSLPLEVLAANRSWGNLEQLHLATRRRGDESVTQSLHTGLDRFLQCDQWPKLTELRLGLHGFDDTNVRQLLNSPVMNSLKNLHLWQCDVSDLGAEQLIEDERILDLENFSIYSSALSRGMTERLADLGFHVGDPVYGEEFGDIDDLEP